MSATSPPPRVPLVDLDPEVQELWPDLLDAVTGVLRSGRYILGPNVEAFEREVADYLGCAHAVGVNSGTDAIAIALRAAGIGPRDEVVTSPFTFVATAEAIATIGARPVFADIDPSTFNVDPAQVERRLTSRTRAIVPVHLYGAPAAMGELRAVAEPQSITVIEDAAQAFGASIEGRKVGTFGRAAAFSFFPSKPLGGFGDGGLISTDDADVAAAARRLRVHGAARKNYSEEVGCNSRLDEIQAAMLRVKLRRVDAAARLRRELVDRYVALLSTVPGVVPPARPLGAVHHLCTVRILDRQRDTVVRALSAAGIASAVHYPVPLHRLASYADPGITLPEAERAAAEVLSLPLWPRMATDIVEEVVGVIAAVLS